MAEVEPEPVVWIINSQHWPRAYLRAELIQRGFDAIGSVRLSEPLAALRHPGIRKPRAIVLELRELDLACDELETLKRASIRLIALGGAAELSNEWIGESERAIVLRRPFTIGAVADAVEGLVRRSM